MTTETLVIQSTGQTLTVTVPQVSILQVAQQGPPGATNYRNFTVTLDAPAIAAARITLPDTPTTRVNVMPQYGVPQFQDIDFSVTGKVLQWAGLGLQLLVAVGDVLLITYSA